MAESRKSMLKGSEKGSLPGTFAAVDLKSFYASVECMARGLDPMKAYLVVADESRTEKTICLAVSPALRAFGLGGRCRLFEVYQKLQEVKNRTGESIPLVVAPPRMQAYMDTSTRIYEEVYLHFIGKEDIHVYSIDEVMMDLTPYLSYYKTDARTLVTRMILRLQGLTGLTATGGIGTNLYLAKVAMDILAKHEPADENGVRIAELDEMSYRRRLWDQPLRSFWRVGAGIARRLGRYGIETMGDAARASIDHPDLLYHELGVDAELLIDHAWGLESCTMADIKAYRSEAKSISSGQVLPEPYPHALARIIVQEMTDQLSMELLGQRLKCQGVSLTIGYDREIVDNGTYRGKTEVDRYGRTLPKSAHGHKVHLGADGKPRMTCSVKALEEMALSIFDEVADPKVTIRRMYLVYEKCVDRDEPEAPRQLSLFTDEEAVLKEKQQEEKEAAVQEAILGIKDKYGKNALLRGMSLLEGATGKARNETIGGHRQGDVEI